MASTSPPPDPPPVPPAVVKRVQATRKLKLNVSDTTVLIQRLNTEWTEHLQSLPIREDAIFSNIQRVATCLANAQLKVLVETVRPGNADCIIDSLLSTPTVPGRNVAAMTQSPVQHADSWQIRWKLNDTGPYALSTRQATISDTVPYFQVQKGDDVTIRKVADVLGELHNIWPYPDTDPGTRSMFVQIAVRRATNTNNKIVLQPHYEPEFGFVLRLWHIDPDTGLAKTIVFRLTPTEAVMGKCLPVPDVSSNVLLYKFKDASSRSMDLVRRDASGKWQSVKPQNLPADWTKENFDRGERFMLYASERLTGLVASTERMDDVFQFLKVQFDIPIVGTGTCVWSENLSSR